MILLKTSTVVISISSILYNILPTIIMWYTISNILYYHENKKENVSLNKIIKPFKGDIEVHVPCILATSIFTFVYHIVLSQMGNINFIIEF